MPAEHEPHILLNEAPTLEENVPAKQLVQEVAAEADQVPAPQVKQVAGEIALDEPDQVPAGQLVQAAEPE